MQTLERIIIEKIKSAKELTIVIDKDLELKLNPNKKLYHDIALAYQSAVVNGKKQ